MRRSQQVFHRRRARVRDLRHDQVVLTPARISIEARIEQREEDARHLLE